MWCHLSAKLHLSLVTTFSHTYPWLSVILFLHLIIYLLEAVGFLTLGDSSPFGLTKSDMTALQSCFGFPSSVTVNSTIFFPPPPGSTCYGKVSFDCSLPYLKMIVGLFCTSFFFFIGSSYAMFVWSAHLCTSIHLNLLFVNPLFLTLVALNLSISKTALPDLGSDFCVVLCTARSWNWLFLWVPFNPGNSTVLWDNLQPKCQAKSPTLSLPSPSPSPIPVTVPLLYALKTDAFAVLDFVFACLLNSIRGHPQPPGHVLSSQ